MLLGGAAVDTSQTSHYQFESYGEKGLACISVSAHFPSRPAVMVLIFVYLLIRGPATPWGDVSQALIYHQVTACTPSPPRPHPPWDF